MIKANEKIVDAWRNNQTKKIGYRRTDGTTIYYRGHAIITKDNWHVYIRTDGWNTRTTMMLLNTLSSVEVCHRNFILYLNGEEWVNHERWTPIM